MARISTFVPRPDSIQCWIMGLVIVNGRQRTFFTTVDWADPGFIPAMDAQAHCLQGQVARL